MKIPSYFIGGALCLSSISNVIADSKNTDQITAEKAKPGNNPTFGILDPSRHVDDEQREAYDNNYRRHQPHHPYWIWSTQPKTEKGATFRKTFVLNEIPQQALLTATMDGSLDVLINGQKVWESKDFPLAQRSFISFGEQRTFNDFSAASVDLSSFLKLGENTVELRAKRNKKEAGLAVMIDMVSSKNVRTRVTTDETWTTEEGKSAVSFGGIGSLTYRWPILGIPYENHPLPEYLRVIPVAPETAQQLGLGSKVKIHQIDHLHAIDGRCSNVVIPSAVKKLTERPDIRQELEKRNWPITPICGHPQNVKDVDPLLELKTEAPAVMFDFGRVVHGRLQIATATNEPVQILVHLGESAGEAELLPNLGTQWRTISPKGTVEMPESAFRFAKIWFIHSTRDSPLSLDGIKLDFVHYPVKYLGSFHSSDPLLEKIWETGLHTAHLNMQDAIWDGPKRDRGSWAECVYFVSMASHYVFADRFLIEQSLNFHRQQIGNPPRRPSNGYVGHTARFLRGVVNHYRFTGDQEFLKSYADYLIPLLDFMKSRFFEDGNWLFTNPNNDGLHIDCVEPYVAKDNLCNQIGVHMMLYQAFKEGAWMLRQLNTPLATTKASEIDGWLRGMKQAADAAWWDAKAGIYGKNIQATEQANALAVSNSLAGPEQAQAIFESLFKSPWRKDRKISPYGMTYLLDALMALPEPETAVALEKMRSYYGTLLERGFTTFPETDLVNVGQPPIVPGIGPDWHRRHDRYSSSLAHGTSGTQPVFLGRYVLGVWPIAPGFAECDIKPHLGDLDWAEGTVPTPFGLIKLRHEKKNGTFISKVELPAGVKANIVLPILNGEQPQLELNGRHITAGKQDGRNVIFNAEK